MRPENFETSPLKQRRQFSLRALMIAMAAICCYSTFMTGMGVPALLTLSSLPIFAAEAWLVWSLLRYCDRFHARDRVVQLGDLTGSVALGGAHFASLLAILSGGAVDSDSDPIRSIIDSLFRILLFGVVGIFVSALLALPVAILVQFVVRKTGGVRRAWQMGLVTGAITGTLAAAVLVKFTGISNDRDWLLLAAICIGFPTTTGCAAGWLSDRRLAKELQLAAAKQQGPAEDQPGLV